MTLKFGNNRGQATVEYILLIAVLMILLNGVFKSQLFVENFGKNGKLYTSYRKQFEHAYRNGFPYEGNDNYDYENLHPTYSPGSGETRFFIAKDPYPQN
jgi:hypothetical protein